MPCTMVAFHINYFEFQINEHLDFKVHFQMKLLKPMMAVKNNRSAAFDWVDFITLDFL